MNIESSVDTSSPAYAFYLEGLFEHIVVCHGLTVMFDGKESSIEMSVKVKVNGETKEIYKHETMFISRRRCIEQFIISSIEKAYQLPPI